MSVRHTLLLLACALCSGTLAAGCSQHLPPNTSSPAKPATVNSHLQDTSAMSLPKASRIPPPDVPPIEHRGIRYEQEMQGVRHGLDQSTGYLVAIDPATNERLWVLKVYETSNVPGLEQDVQRRYFKRMELIEGRDALQIENETGQRFIVDLAQRTSSPAP